MKDSTERLSTSGLLGVSALIVGVWLIFGFFNTSEFHFRSLAGDMPANWRDVLIFQTTASLIWATFTPFVFAIAERLPIGDGSWKRNVVLLAALIPLLSVIRSAGGGLWQQLAENDPLDLSFAWLSVQVRFHRNVFLLLVVVGIVNIIVAHRRSVRREQHAYVLQAEVTNAALAQLRSAMLPRVMFDTLRAITDRVERDPMQADQMIVGLSDLLRATLDLDRRGEITLAEELEHIDRYLDLERTRASGQLTTRIEFDEPLLGARVPPLVLHTLVEHALAADADHHARKLLIRGREQGNRLRIEIETDGAANGASRLDEAPQRLEQLLIEHFSLDRRSDGGTDIVTLELPLRVAEVTS